MLIVNYFCFFIFLFIPVGSLPLQRFALPAHLTMGNFTGGAHKSGTKSAGETGSGLASYVASLIDKTLTWNDIAWVRKNTTMKIVVKGT